MSTSGISSNRYLTLGLLFFAGIFNLFDRQIVNVLAQDIKTDLHITDAELGMITGTAFGLFYSILGLPLGRLADRVDRIKLIAAALFVWSAFTAASGAAASFVQLFLARMGVGVGEATWNPASASLIADQFPERRTSALSILLVSSPVGSFLGLWVGGHVATVWGWRSAFLIAGLPGVLLALLILLVLRRERTEQTRNVQAGPSFWGAFPLLMGRPAFRWLLTANLCIAFTLIATGGWLPAYLIRMHGVSTAETGRLSAIAIGLGGGIGTLGAGTLCDALRRRISQPESKMLMGCVALSLPALLIALLSTDLTVAVAAMFVFNLFGYAYLAPINALTQQSATPETRALSVGLLIGSATIFSFGAGIPLLGALSDRLAPQYGPRSIAMALLVCIPAGAMSIAANWRAARLLRTQDEGTNAPQPRAAA